MGDKLVTIATFSDEMQAELARQMLEEFEIKSVLIGANALNTMPYLAIVGLEGVKLQVLESQAEKAKEILSEKNQQEPSSE